jgi:hypothetical protein
VPKDTYLPDEKAKVTILAKNFLINPYPNP